MGELVEHPVSDLRGQVFEHPAIGRVVKKALLPEQPTPHRARSIPVTVRSPRARMAPTINNMRRNVGWVNATENSSKERGRPMEEIA